MDTRTAWQKADERVVQKVCELAVQLGPATVEMMVDGLAVQMDDGSVGQMATIMVGELE